MLRIEVIKTKKGKSPCLRRADTPGLGYQLLLPLSHQPTVTAASTGDNRASSRRTLVNGQDANPTALLTALTLLHPVAAKRH